MTEATKKATSLYAMSKIDKENVRRRDQIMVSPDVLVIEEGFNVRGRTLVQMSIGNRNM